MLCTAAAWDSPSMKRRLEDDNIYYICKCRGFVQYYYYKEAVEAEAVEAEGRRATWGNICSNYITSRAHKLYLCTKK